MIQTGNPESYTLIASSTHPYRHAVIRLIFCIFIIALPLLNLMSLGLIFNYYSTCSGIQLLLVLDSVRHAGLICATRGVRKILDEHISLYLFAYSWMWWQVYIVIVLMVNLFINRLETKGCDYLFTSSFFWINVFGVFIPLTCFFISYYYLDFERINESSAITLMMLWCMSVIFTDVLSMDGFSH